MNFILFVGILIASCIRQPNQTVTTISLAQISICVLGYVAIGLALYWDSTAETIIKTYLSDIYIIIVAATAFLLVFYGQIVISWLFTKRYIEITFEMASFDQKQDSKTHF
jgi:hypothetical protein